MRLPAYLPLAVIALLCARHAPASPTPGATISGNVTVVGADGKRVKSPKDVWVYLDTGKPSHGKHRPGVNRTFQLAQQNTQFSRPSLVIPLGATVWFPNLDPFEHNVFSPSEPMFDLKRYSTDKVGKSNAFEEVGLYDIYCDIHKNMNATIKVVDSAWIAEVQPDGSYTITGVPPGTYKVVVWAPTSPEVKSPSVSVTNTNTAAIVPGQLNLQLGPPPGPHPNKNLQPYVIYPP